MLVSYRVVNLVLVIVANSCDVEELDVVSEFNPENTVVLCLEIYLRLRARGPQA